MNGTIYAPLWSSDKITGKSCFNSNSPKAAWHQLFHNGSQLGVPEWASELVTRQGKSLSTVGKRQLLNPLFLVIMHSKWALKKRRRNFSHPGVKQEVSRQRTALQGVFGFSCQILSDVMWSNWRRRRCHCMPSDCRAILIKYPLFSLSSLSCSAASFHSLP